MGPRPRSNALTGPKDPRAPDPLRLALQTAKPVADSLRSFLRTVFSRDDLMKDTATQKWPDKSSGKPVSPTQLPDNLADKIYQLYTAQSTAGAGRDEMTMRSFVTQLEALRKKYADLVSSVELQNYGLTLEALLQKKGPEFTGPCSDFIYFKLTTKLSAAYRVYVNAKFDKIATVFDALLAHMKKNPGNNGVSSFKSAGPGMAKRADTIVIYCSSEKFAKAIATELLKIDDAYELAVPEMTTRQHDTSGIALGAEPTWQATGLGAHRGKKYETVPMQQKFGTGSAPYAPQSFGSVRAEAIAAAILNYQMNQDLIVGDKFEAFVRFVSVAFAGLGLDPQKPGD